MTTTKTEGHPHRACSTALVMGFVLAWALAGCIEARNGVLDLSWTPPTTNLDGSPLTDIVSYRVYYGPSLRPCPGGTVVAFPAQPTTPGQSVRARLTGLKVGALYYVSVTAVSSSGTESGCSTEASARARKPD